KVPYGQGIAQTALQRAKEKGPPKCAEEYDLPETRLLLGIFRELQAIQGDKPVFLSCRLAAHLVGMPEKYGKLNNIINMLQADGLLVRIAPGTEFKSPRYRYVGGE
ncbi:MAG: hypothetical protein HYS12_07235, partial [Planctomycetes bacterium]|nr:hypothetical protein [Planctomycetota bacterium]